MTGEDVNAIWGITRPRSMLTGLLLAVALAASLGGVALSSFVATTALTLVARFTRAVPGSVAPWQTAASALSVLTMAGVFYVLYRYTPRRRVEFADVWPAALVTALLWEATRWALAAYLQMNRLVSGYGPIGAAMALLVWMYAGSLITLLGAEIAYATAKDRRHLRPESGLPAIDLPGAQAGATFAPPVAKGVPAPAGTPVGRSGPPSTGPGPRQGAGGRAARRRAAA